MGSSPARRPVIGVFGGSFNPPHIGHQLLVHYVLGRGLVDRVVVLPCYAHAFGKALCAFEHRCRWLQEMFQHETRVQVCGIEATLRHVLGHAPRSLEVLDALALRFPHAQLRWIIGQDILDSGETARWYRWDELQARYPLLVIPRATPETPGVLPLVSSSQIRDAWENSAQSAWVQAQLPGPVAESRKLFPGPWPMQMPPRIPPVAWVVGQGKAGRAMEMWLQNQGVVVQSWSAQKLLAGAYTERLSTTAFPNPQLIWLASRPDQSADVLHPLRTRINAIEENVFVCSSAGAYSADKLRLAPGLGPRVQVGTLHPVTSLTGAPEPLASAYFGWSGPPELGRWLQQWLGADRLVDLNGLDAQGRMAYHAACALSSNYWGGILERAAQAWVEQGVDRDKSLGALAELMAASLRNLRALGVPDGVSGALVRGQDDQVRQHQAQWREGDAALHAALVEVMRRVLQGRTSQP